MKQIGIVFICALMLLTLTLPAQEGRGGGRVTGVVTDEADNPLEGVKITMESLQYNFKLETVSGKEGRWTLFGFGIGGFRFIAEKEGYLRAISQTQLSGVNRNPKQKIILKSLKSIKEQPVKGKDSKVNFKNANALYNAGSYPEALSMFKAFLEKNPKFYKVNINIGNCHFKLKQYDEAIVAYQLVLDGMKAEGKEMAGNASAAQMYAGIGEAYMVRNDFKKAEENFKKAIEIDPSDRALPYNVAEILFNAGNVGEAIAYYEKAIAISPDWPKAYRQLGYAWLNKGDMAQAVKAFNVYLEKAKKDDPQVPVIRDLVKSLSQ